ncbi:MAG: hypothetical protein NC921_04015 [Candidatus Omnitrophica bacterium]|nr:hypothetical protein [Candidatus Omnitrophota bacterium]
MRKEDVKKRIHALFFACLNSFLDAVDELDDNYFDGYLEGELFEELIDSFLYTFKKIKKLPTEQKQKFIDELLKLIEE